MIKSEWVLCPICGNKTHTKMRVDTEMKNFPLFCPKCKKESLVDVKKLTVAYSREHNIKERIIK